MSKTKRITRLLLWMEDHLKQEAEFSSQEIAAFFADTFIINTNGRVVGATPPTYKDYLYTLKKTLSHVKYGVMEHFETPNAVFLHS